MIANIKRNELISGVRKAAMLMVMLGEEASGQLMRGLTEDEVRSEEHTSELQSPCNLVCRLLLEKKTQPLHSSGKTLSRCRDVRTAASPADGGPSPPEKRERRTEGKQSSHCELLIFFFFKGFGAPRNLPSFPPRRSSD